MCKFIVTNYLKIDYKKKDSFFMRGKNDTRLVELCKPEDDE